MAEMVFSKILIKSLNLAENPYKIPKFGGKTNYIKKIGGDIISRNSTFFHVCFKGSDMPGVPWSICRTPIGPT